MGAPEMAGPATHLHLLCLAPGGVPPGGAQTKKFFPSSARQSGVARSSRTALQERSGPQRFSASFIIVLDFLRQVAASM